MKRKSKGEFFEVFRRQPEPGSSLASAHGAARPAEAYHRPPLLRLGPIGATVTALAVVAAVIGAYALGRWTRVPSDAVPPPLGVSSAASPTGEAAPDAPFYSLRIVSGIPLENAARLRADLRAMGYRDVLVYPARGQSGYTVNVGIFPDLAATRQADAARLKETFRGMTYRGTKDVFATCYFDQIKEPGRILHER